jgi:hypothetical protein
MLALLLNKFFFTIVTIEHVRFDIEKKTLSKLLLHFALILLQFLAHSTKVIARGAFVAPV